MDGGRRTSAEEVDGRLGVEVNVVVVLVAIAAGGETVDLAQMDDGVIADSSLSVVTLISVSACRAFRHLHVSPGTEHTQTVLMSGESVLEPRPETPPETVASLST